MGFKHVWTEEMEQLIVEQYPEKGAKGLMSILGLTQRAIAHKANRMKVGYKYPGQAAHKARKSWTVEREAILLARYEQEGSVTLAQELGISAHAIRQRASILGLKSLNHQQHRIVSLSKNVHSVNIHYFDEWSPNMAWLLGFTWADGSIVHVKNHLYRISWGVSIKDEEIIHAIQKEIQSTHKLDYHKKRISTFYGKQYISQPAVYLHIYNTYLTKMLLEKYYVPPRKSFLDPSYPYVPDAFAGHFIRGFMDGDGSVGQYGQECRLTLCSAGMRFLQGLQQQVCFLIDVHRGTISQNGKTYQVRWTKKDDLIKLAKFLYPSGDYLYLSRKKQMFDNFFININ